MGSPIANGVWPSVMGLEFFKMTGSGNDFVMVDGRVYPVASWTPGMIASICARRTGVGADGLVILEPGSGTASVRFHFFNNDGHRASMCGNASLCATRLAARLGLADPTGMTLETDAGAFRTRCLEGPGERAEIELPDVNHLVSPPIELADGERGAYLVTVGVPHLVVLTDESALASHGLMERGRELRWHPAIGPHGANVNFVGSAGAKYRMRTYERGVEAETLACGTGAVAVVAVLASIGRAELPSEILTTSGQCLSVSGSVMAADRQLRAPRLGGEGRLVFRGSAPEFGPNR